METRPFGHFQRMRECWLLGEWRWPFATRCVGLHRARPVSVEVAGLPGCALVGIGETSRSEPSTRKSGGVAHPEHVHMHRSRVLVFSGPTLPVKRHRGEPGHTGTHRTHGHLTGIPRCLFTGIRVPVCARVSCVSRVCPGFPRCLFTSTVQYSTHCAFHLTLYTSSGVSRYGRRGRARARQHRLRRFEHERQVILRSPAAQVGDAKGIPSFTRCAGGRREGDPEEDHRDEDAPFIKDALKATGRG